MIGNQFGTRQETPEELAQKAIDALAAVDSRREQRRAELRADTDAYIAALVGPSHDQNRVLIRQMNLLAAAVQGVRAEAKGAATPELVAQLDALEAVYAKIEAAREAENTASAALDAAGVDARQTPAERIAEIEAVTVSLPK
ncbi:MAG: hypothetical protein IT495_17035 [Gammaproteobacteria bacterium]|nr:hypothetical protein [Gammaproteobacteria bacterium]